MLFDVHKFIYLAIRSSAVKFEFTGRKSNFIQSSYSLNPLIYLRVLLELNTTIFLFCRKLILSTG
jgi:hypothetical protein